MEHAYRSSIRELRRQWRAYAAGRAWLAHEYPSFHPQPAAVARGPEAASGRPVALRAQLRVRRCRCRGTGSARAGCCLAGGPGLVERARFLAIDALLAIEELVGLRLANTPPARRPALRRPRRARRPRERP